MEGLPLLVFPNGVATDRGRRGGGAANFHKPDTRRQTQRLGGKFQRLRNAIDARRAELAESALGIRPEKVLVLETIGPIEKFAGAIRRSGFEWLFEWSEDDIAPDDDFFNLRDPTKPLGGRLFLSMADGTALDQFLALWQRWRRREKMEWGFGKWNDLFSQLKDVRYWGANDRLDTGVVEYWRNRLEADDERIRFEVELWYRQNQSVRDLAARRTRELVAQAQGVVVRECVLPEIAYHAMISEVPAATLQDFIAANEENIHLLRADEVMYFRAVGQCLVESNGGAPNDQPNPELQDADALGSPIVALLDGAPLTQHEWLADTIELDDPENWSEAYGAGERRHGTMMASLIIHGDQNEPTQPLDRRLYVRPILKPDPLSFNRPRHEGIPADELPIDLVHRAVARLFEPRDDQPSVAPGIRIVNLSIGDPNQLFYRTVSAWARLLDWLAWHYQVLFVISAGNHAETVELSMTTQEFLDLDPDDRQSSVFQAIRNSIPSRRLLAPSESINALTIGSVHYDSANVDTPPHLVDVYSSTGMPSPINPIGTGHRRAIKPECIVPGGRLLYETRIGQQNERAILDPVKNLAPPGQLAAMPGVIAGRLDQAGFTAGTSNAAAAISRAGSAIFDEVIQELEIPDDSPEMERRHEISLIKALLVHGASWGATGEQLEQELEKENALERKSLVSAFLGYGVPEFTRVLGCTDQRITLLTWGDLKKESAVTYSVPLPAGLTESVHERRLTVTLAWLTPCNMQNQRYRRGFLWCDPPAGARADNLLRVDRCCADWQAVRRGTLQHEVLVGSRALDYAPDANLSVRVNCAADAGALDDPIPFGLAVTLEVAEGIPIQIYEQVSVRIQEQLAVRV